MCIKSVILVFVLTPFAANSAASCNIDQMFKSAIALLNARQYDSAAGELDHIRACGGLSAVQRFQLGWLYGRARHFSVALQIFESVPADTPDPLEHGYAIALSKFELGDYQGCVETLRKLQTHVGLDASSENLLAVSYSKLGLYQEAYAVLSEAIRRNPTDLNSHLNVITVCAEGGDFNRAAQFASQAVDLFPHSSEVFIVRGAAFTLLGRLDAAYQDFSRAAQLSPDRPDARFFLALIDYKQAKFSDALAVLRSAQNEGIADADVDCLAAECLLKIDPTDVADALRYLDRAIALSPESTAARALRGKLFLDANQPRRALEDLELAVKQDPSSKTATYNLARVYRTLGRAKEAEALFQKLRGQGAGTLNELGDARLSGVLTRNGGQP